MESNMTLEEKLKMVRLGKDVPIPFKYKGVDYQGRKLDWLETLQCEAEVKGMLHVANLDLTQPDQWIFMKVAILNKAIFVPLEKLVPDWLVETRKPEGVEFLREFYNSYESAVHPEIAEKVEKKTPAETAEEKVPADGQK